MAAAGEVGRDREAFSRKYPGRAAQWAFEGKRNPAGECRHDGAGEGDQFSHRCPVVSEGSAEIGTTGQSGRDPTATKLPAVRETGFSPTGSICPCQADEASATGEPE